MNDDIFSYYEEQEDAEMRVFIRDGDIVIREENSFDYEIPLTDCTTVTGALNWIEHIRHKTWMTDAMLSRVIRLMVEHNGGQFDD